MSKKRILKFFGAAGAVVAGATTYRLSSNSLDWANNVVSASSVGNENKNPEKPELTLKLKQVQIYFRHGARTPLSEIPNIEKANWDKQLFLTGVPHTLFNYTLCDLNGGPPPDSPLENHYRKTILKGGSYIGQLTSLGQDQTYLLGRRIRRRYIQQFGLIGAAYDPENFYCRSTNTQRTIDSLRCVVAGIFGAEHLNEVGNVTLYTAHVRDEVLFPNSQRCSFLKQLIHKTLTNFGNIDGVREDRLLLEQVLGVDSSSDVKKRLNMVNIRDNLVCRVSHGFLIPEAMQEFESRLMKYGLDMMVYAYTGTKGSFQQDVLRASVGLSLDLMLTKMDEAVKGKKGPKMMLYSCHDTSIISLIMALGIYDDKWPPFAADVAVELYEDKKGEHFVKVNYNGENVTERGFGSPVVSLQKLKEDLARFVVADATYIKLCQGKFPERLEAPLGLKLPDGSHLPDHQETLEEASDADEHSVRPAGM